MAILGSYFLSVRLFNMLSALLSIHFWKLKGVPTFKIDCVHDLFSRSLISDFIRGAIILVFIVLDVDSRLIVDGLVTEMLILRQNMLSDAVIMASYHFRFIIYILGL